MFSMFSKLFSVFQFDADLGGISEERMEELRMMSGFKVKDIIRIKRFYEDTIDRAAMAAAIDASGGSATQNAAHEGGLDVESGATAAPTSTRGNDAAQSRRNGAFSFLSGKPSGEPEVLMTREVFENIECIKLNPLKDRIMVCFGYAIDQPNPLATQDSMSIDSDGEKNSFMLNSETNDASKDQSKPKSLTLVAPLDAPTIRSVGKMQLNFQDFLVGLSAFNSPGSREQKLRLAFRIQDFDGDGVINKSDLTQYLERITAPHLSELEIAAVVEATFAEIASDVAQEVITYSDFQQIVSLMDFQAKLRIPIF